MRRSLVKMGKVDRWLPFVASGLACLAVNLWALRIDQRFDLTSAGVYSLSPESLATAEAVSRPVEITFFVDRRSQAMRDAADLLERLAASNSRIRLRVADPLLEPGLAEAHNVRFAGTTVYESEGRRVTTHGGTETEFVNGLIRVTQEHHRLVCFSDGHVEADPASLESHDHSESDHSHDHASGGRPLRVHERHGFGMARRALEVLGYRVEKRNLTTGPEPLAGCTLLVIASPQMAFLESEVEIVRAFVASGGPTLAMLEPGIRSGLEGLLSSYGLEVGAVALRDETRHYGTDPATPAVTEYPRHQITRDLGLTFFPGVAEIEPGDRPRSSGILVTPLIQASADTQPNGLERSRTLAAYVVGQGSEDGRERLLVIGDGDFATNSYFHVLGNGQLFLNSVNVLAEAPTLLDLAPRHYQQASVALTNRQMLSTFFVSTLLLPTLLAVLGLRVYWRGR